ncbi:hypothetical protein K503DRAFT_784059 [Rhizopogon vinicolor AM-OR11-026]|uniref:Uncharacterized protein n=1 Tax=Rhizopogon vinicolor AM-OR11-026 TaxID=1314800 RepID=A0A1B7MW65_9AGAM|nr:hypothetical protein K503DRAFT_784059 [Rhizopogon vinicolor AM-OR11-026]
MYASFDDGANRSSIWGCGGTLFHLDVAPRAGDTSHISRDVGSPPAAAASNWPDRWAVRGGEDDRGAALAGEYIAAKTSSITILHRVLTAGFGPLSLLAASRPNKPRRLRRHLQRRTGQLNESSNVLFEMAQEIGLNNGGPLFLSRVAHAVSVVQDSGRGTIGMGTVTQGFSWAGSTKKSICAQVKMWENDLDNYIVVQAHSKGDCSGPSGMLGPAARVESNIRNAINFVIAKL